MPIDDFDNFSIAQWIDYLEGTISDAERSAMETVLRSSQQARDQLRGIMAIYAQNGKDKSKTLQFYQKLAQGSPFKQPKAKATLRILSVAVAAAAVLLVLFLVTMPTVKYYQLSQAVDRHWERVAGFVPPLKRSAGAESWQSSYNKKRYGDVLLAVVPALQSGRATDDQRFFAAMAYLLKAHAEPDKALPLLESLTKNQGPFAERALWTLALLHLREGNLAQAKHLLNQMIEDANGQYALSAAELRDLID